jgi:diacylglycerol kinase (ATP)
VKLLKKIWNGLTYAVKGVWYGFYTRKNISLFVGIAMMIAALLLWLGTSRIKFTLIIAAWMVVIIVEITNTAIEKIIDTLHPGFSEGMGRAKDMMAGAVFIALIAASFVTLLMVWDPLKYRLFH